MLRLDENDLRVLVAHLPDFVVLLDGEARFAWCNRVDPTLNTEEIIGKGVEHFVVGPDREVARQAVEHCLRTGETMYYESLGYGEGAYATYYGCRVVALPPDQSGRPRAILLSTDVTERRWAQEQRDRSDARFRQLVESSPDWIVSIDEQRVISYVNRPRSESPAFPGENLIGSAVDDIIADGSRASVVEAIEAALHAGTPALLETHLASGQGMYRLRVVPLPANEGTPRHALLVFNDVTEERRAAAQREVMLAELDHRSKNVLAMVAAIAERTLAREHSLTGFREAFMGRLHSLAASHEALAAARWEHVDLQRLVEVVIGPVADRARILAQDACNPALPSRVVTPLALVLHELATNAVKHGALSRPEGRLRLESRCERGGSLHLRWIEEGVAQASPSSERGFGLTLVRGLVEDELGGTLSLEVLETSRTYQIEFPTRGEVP